MALIKQVPVEERIDFTSVKWVNEHDHPVIYLPATQFFSLPLSEEKQTVYLLDPAKARVESGYNEHYRLYVVGMSICGAGHYVNGNTPFIAQADYDITDVDEVQLLPGHYPLFSVLVDGTFYNMVDYYENELFKA